ncbi:MULTISPECIES: TRAP transporter substrate-binding protein [Thalassospira]|jgi:TRAP-type mannitol/chloroaromatic compound transport system substrate-binding protein|uniref:C4-dicarboxylate ABC transporter n=1 Tax=Thalassospira povalilytica TaxID=732237 RepID=A0A8I1M6L1_9PROT|nr:MULTISPECIES: TRAP transporter substrate-binding protein [Thalassospira]MEE3046918.1 TRAP transporter substrate-binding protein [Pseudomonadota bacterium]RCK22796.1 C4-dicarboxylate ABC transporter [Thalassospira profundimaris]KZB59981.1 C4-dicarboxylate ABC transporter [Thalassospira sp. MCCC 1A02491]MAL38645.1 C4-dicarboxylate ABC transporter [Thalassospira sp.]MBN8196243.1 TRAP transporter substrate-binding protein [Thalassospira povalilytica]|tara:strand:+ start:2958 stop:4019 length:1062 start_codon:yes stop_codon:yes gene_type:complete|eukprot:TRINITY_DN2716_c0_g8_i1.p1 TRINITY_DN2716_c0_g8~~TRINITY_DN2716_c0_g8_i1.p1  ORF type:complete len:354 (-),score=79.44 TRINITY_DN2716_c0_g8_i1:1208-2269(-)
MTFSKLLKSATCAAVLAAAAFSVAPSDANAQERVRWKMGSTYPGSLTQLGTLGKRVDDKIDEVSGGNIKIKFYEPGALVPALEVFDAVSTGSIDAAFSTPGYWAGKVPALQLFGSVPFGPQAGEYLAWVKFGGGQEIFDKLYAEHGIKSLFCGLIAPEASGWFSKEINTVEDLKGLKMRFFGLGAKVMEKLGVSTQLLSAGDIYPALELGTIDATEFSMPAIDLKLGFHQVAKYYYFPGWHQQSTFFDLMMNKEKWDALDKTQQAQIEAVCNDNLAYGFAEGEAIQFAALKELQEKGVNIKKWSPEMLGAMRGAWEEVAAELSADDADFKMAYESLQEFRANYKIWKDIGYLD